MYYTMLLESSIELVCPTSELRTDPFCLSVEGVLIPITKDVYIRVFWKKPTEAICSLVTETNKQKMVIDVAPVLDLFDGKIYNQTGNDKEQITVSAKDLTLFREIRDEFIDQYREISSELMLKTLYDELGDDSDFLKECDKKKGVIMSFPCPITKIFIGKYSPFIKQANPEDFLHVLGYIVNYSYRRDKGDKELIFVSKYLVSWSSTGPVTAEELTEDFKYPLGLILKNVPYLCEVTTEEANAIENAIVYAINN